LREIQVKIKPKLNQIKLFVLKREKRQTTENSDTMRISAHNHRNENITFGFVPHI
jgi:hypothetical protein